MVDIKTTAQRLVACCRENRTMEGLDELYDADAVSVEAVAPPGAASAETRGVEAIKGKHEWWDTNCTVHSASVEGPYLHGTDRFAVIFEMDATNKLDGRRNAMKEVGIYTVNDAAKIVREEFYYDS